LTPNSAIDASKSLHGHAALKEMNRLWGRPKGSQVKKTSYTHMKLKHVNLNSGKFESAGGGTYACCVIRDPCCAPVVEHETSNVFFNVKCPDTGRWALH